MAVSMAEAAKIRNVAERHAYVFDNGLSSPDFFDLEKRTQSEEFLRIKWHCEPEHRIVEVGCFTGLNLLGLGHFGHRNLTGIDFVPGALKWLERQAEERQLPIRTHCFEFPDFVSVESADRIICFDVLEHQLNVGHFLEGVRNSLRPQGQVLILVPAGREYFDCGHTAFWPDAECLANTLDYFFEIKEIGLLETCPKIFAVCERRN